MRSDEEVKRALRAAPRAVHLLLYRPIDPFGMIVKFAAGLAGSALTALAAPPFAARPLIQG